MTALQRVSLLKSLILRSTYFRKTHSVPGHAGTARHLRMLSPGMGRRRVSTTRESHSCVPPWRGGRMRKDCALIRRRAGNWRLPCGRRFPGKILHCTVIISRMTRLSALLNTGWVAWWWTPLMSLNSLRMCMLSCAQKVSQRVWSRIRRCPCSSGLHPVCTHPPTNLLPRRMRIRSLGCRFSRALRVLPGWRPTNLNIGQPPRTNPTRCSPPVFLPPRIPWNFGVFTAI